MNEPYPNNTDAECAVLGAMLSPEGGAAVMDIVLAGGLKPSDFYKTDHQKICRAVFDIHNAGKPIDLVSVSEKLQASGELDAVGGVAYLDELIDAVPTVANAGYYASEVRKAAQLRAIIQVAYTISRRAYEPEAEPTKLLSELQELIDQNNLSESIGGKIPTAKDDWSEVFKQLCQGQQSELLGLRTGFEGLDRATLGLRGLCVLGGIPGQGKTSLALQLATEIARLNDIPVLFYALEMSKFDLYVKITSRLAKLDWTTLVIGSEIDGRRGRGLSDEDVDKLNAGTAAFMEFADRLQIIDRAVCQEITLPMVRLHIQQAKKLHGVDQIFIVVDHLQIIPTNKPELTDMKARLDYLVGEFKAISEQYNATILLISEKNRSSYERQWLGAYMGSAGIEYGVDVAMLLYEQGEEHQGDRGAEDQAERDIELRIVKNRFGQKNTVRLRFYGAFSCFAET